MFIGFFLHLRRAGIPVSTTEFLALLQALRAGLALENLPTFYSVARAILVKRPQHYDVYDRAFAAWFEDLTLPENLAQTLHDELLDWLAQGARPRALDPEELATLQAMDLDALRRLFQERLAEQTERHDGGHRWIGTGGTSPFGHSGTHPSGIRVGGASRNRSAVQIASERRFQNLRDDVVLDTRQIAMALRRLKELRREGPTDELDLEASIQKTGQSGGEVELVMRAPRKSTLKVLLLMDVGGSMTPHAHASSQLFSAALRLRHFKVLRPYYFHNCPYEWLYEDISRGKRVDTAHVLGQLDAAWRCIVVGDAAMAPMELMEAGGAIDYFHFNERPGIYWLQKLRETIPRTVWLNPEQPRWWTGYTTQVIASLFPMFPLTIAGLDDAVQALRQRL